VGFRKGSLGGQVSASSRNSSSVGSRDQYTDPGRRGAKGGETKEGSEEDKN